MNDNTTEKNAAHSRYEVFCKLLNAKLPPESEENFTVNKNTEPLASLNYELEVDIKNIAINDYWKVFRLPGRPEKVIPSPLPRHYRTTSKRRASLVKNKLLLTFTDSHEQTLKRSELYSELEPEAHFNIYRYLENLFNEEKFSEAARNLNYIIIRGTYTEFSVIFNMFKLNGGIVRKLEQAAAGLQTLDINLKSAYIYHSPVKSDYFFDSFDQNVSVQFKKIFGPEIHMLKLENFKCSFHLTSFSQINESILPIMLKTVRENICSNGNNLLFDLYCGYGLFSLYLQNDFREICAVEISGTSVKAAITNAKFVPQNAAKIKFYKENITPKSLEKLVSSMNNPENAKLILDPPRNGTERGVIRYLAELKPALVMHICCGIETVPEEIKEWQKNDYTLIKAIPLDMFPGTYNLETILLFKAAK